MRYSFNDQDRPVADTLGDKGRAENIERRRVPGGSLIIAVLDVKPLAIGYH